MNRLTIKLKELKSKVGWTLPDDPFSGKSFVYKQTAHGFRLYSLGANLRDDGGLPSEAMGGNPSDVGKGDIVWIGEK